MLQVIRDGDQAPRPENFASLPLHLTRVMARERANRHLSVMGDVSSEQARVEQTIGDTEIAITTQGALIDTMIREGEGVYRQSQQLKVLQARLAYFHLRRRMLLAAQALDQALDDAQGLDDAQESLDPGGSR
jgi:hypothetical protein